GVLLFSLLSFLQTGPGIWLIVAGIIFFLVDRKLTYFAIVAFGLVYQLHLGSFIAKAFYGENYVKTVSSPYYRFDVVKGVADEGPLKGSPIGLDIFINYDSFQSLVDCSPENLKRLPKALQDEMIALHGTPFMAFGKPADDVLILGSGSGSDVAGAL